MMWRSDKELNQLVGSDEEQENDSKYYNSCSLSEACAWRFTVEINSHMNQVLQFSIK